MKKLGFFAFEGMADELEEPSQRKEGGGVKPKSMKENTGEEERERNENGRYAQRMADPIHRVLMAGRVLGDPLLAAAVA